jgi:hypothetical protein
MFARNFKNPRAAEPELDAKSLAFLGIPTPPDAARSTGVMPILALLEVNLRLLQAFLTKRFLFGAAKAIGHNRNLAARLPLPKIYPEAIRRTSPELTLQELVNNSSTKIGCFRAVFRVSENGKATEPKGCR